MHASEVHEHLVGRNSVGHKQCGHCRTHLLLQGHGSHSLRSGWLLVKVASNETCVVFWNTQCDITIEGTKVDDSAAVFTEDNETDEIGEFLLETSCEGDS